MVCSVNLLRHGTVHVIVMLHQNAQFVGQTDIKSLILMWESTISETNGRLADEIESATICME